MKGRRKAGDGPVSRCDSSRGQRNRDCDCDCERRGRAVIVCDYKRGRRCPGTVSRTSDRAACGCAGERSSADDAYQVQVSRGCDLIKAATDVITVPRVHAARR